MSFRIGQKVVCVDDSPSRSRFPWLVEGHVQKGAIYTVDGFDPEGIDPGGIGIYLVELPQTRIPPGYKFPCGFSQLRFRPVVERKTDISIFTRMLTPAPRIKEQVLEPQ